jgi:DNA-directed RNA polymerase subunit E'/Rpb7
MDKSKKRREFKLQSIYSKCLLTKTISLPFHVIGKNLDNVIEEYISNNFEGKCIVEGFVKPNSTKITRYSSGIIERGVFVKFEVVFECEICFPVEGTLINCTVKNMTQSGMRCESAVNVPSPVVVYIAKDHHYNNPLYNEVKVGDNITIKVIGHRFELNDNVIEVIGELTRDREKDAFKTKQTRPKLIIED